MSLLATAHVQIEVKQVSASDQSTSTHPRHKSKLGNLRPQSPYSAAVAKRHPQRRFVPQKIRLLLPPGTTLFTQLHIEMPYHSCQYRPHLKICKAKLAKILSMLNTITAGESTFCQGNSGILRKMAEAHLCGRYGNVQVSLLAIAQE